MILKIQTIGRSLGRQVGRNFLKNRRKKRKNYFVVFLSSVTPPMQFSAKVDIHISYVKKIRGQSSFSSQCSISQKIEKFSFLEKIRIFLCFFTKPLPKAFGKGLVKKQRKILIFSKNENFSIFCEILHYEEKLDCPRIFFT